MDMEELQNDVQQSTRETIKQKLRKCFDGKIVRKDLTKKIKEGANVPVYVLEFLLGQYCSSDDPEVIAEGVQTVKRINVMATRELFRLIIRKANRSVVRDTYGMARK